ncbi:hypothetical protein Ait01nite_048000 [Actinoplanes italicus]|uniref:Uncharacterized protein n=1 Tax=Actinoplanes italicus TaxID=113567 RepID=A0A2T0K9S9_9ACTN|nr:hypothetical protein [Actinoplanes italicus]PRX19902.1 hypothetical protein CLV67_109167 [Actinoplanes italicus]GIE31755.1 hypothetical protein Ait01nite_048000 [Actinoplanes italicus]
MTVVALRNRLPDPGRVAGTLAGADPWWTAGAVLLLYRLASCWMMLPLGPAGWFMNHPRRSPKPIIDQHCAP